MVNLGLLKSGKVELRRTIRSGKPENLNHHEEADFRKFRHGQWRSRICGQSQRPSAKQTEKNVERCRVRWRAFNNMGNVHGLQRWMRRHSWWRISQPFKVSSRIMKISRWSRCSMSPHNWWMTRRKSMVWTKFIGKKILGNVCHWLVMKQSSIFKAQKSMSFSDYVLCLGRIHQHPDSNEAWKNRIAGVKSVRSYRDYDGINGEATEFEWNIFIHNVAALWKNQWSTERLGTNTRNFHRKNSIYVNVQWHLLWQKRQQRWMFEECRICEDICEKIWYLTLVIYWTRFWEKVVSFRE